MKRIEHTIVSAQVQWGMCQTCDYIDSANICCLLRNGQSILCNNKAQITSQTTAAKHYCWFV